MTSVINFGAGPAKLPTEVMQQVQRELLNYDNTGISVMEMSHRGADYDKINDTAQQDLRDLLNVPANYKILFLQGGATGCFAAIPMNLMPEGGSADYFVTGTWSAKAAKEAAKYGKVNLVLPKMDKYNDIPDPSTWKLSKDASYVYYCTNETIGGVQFQDIPETNGVPLVADMSSDILSRPIDISKFALIFAGAQKNMGPAGITVVIIREDFLGKARTYCPSILDFTVTMKDNSIHNTPPTFIVYIVGLVYKWLKKQGGVPQIQKVSNEKSNLIYNLIESSGGFYSCTVKNPKYRSRMNIPFRIGSETGDDTLEKEFLNGAQKLGMVQLKGHRSVGGIRVSLYNAITLDETQVLVKYMKEFLTKHKK